MPRYGHNMSVAIWFISVQCIAFTVLSRFAGFKGITLFGQKDQEISDAGGARMLRRFHTLNYWTNKPLSRYYKVNHTKGGILFIFLSITTD